MKRQNETQKFLSTKREQRRLHQIRAKRKRHKKNLESEPYDPRYLPRTLKILRDYVPTNIIEGKNIAEKIKIPQTFSIIDDTERALRTIYQLIAFSKRKHPPIEVFFDHSRLATFDLAAEAILATAAVNFRHSLSGTRRGLRLRGYFPIDSAANRFIRAVGIIKNLNLRPYFLDPEEERKLRVLRFKSYNARLRVYEQSPTERAAQMLVKYLNSCLAFGGFELTEGGRHELICYAGEVLDNAYQHSGTDHWVLVGYMDPASQERMCELTIFNLGKSFADTFLDLQEDHYTRQFVDPFVELHQRRGFLGSRLSLEDLLTVVALQGHVSSKNASANDTRGIGTIDLIQFFQRVHQATQKHGGPSARMVIVSGKTRVQFDGTYSMAPDHSGRPIIAFNSQNRLDLPPDRSHVRSLNGVEFPGTIVSVRFPLSKDVTRRVRKNDE